jgi:hypothetical protein
MFSGLDVLRLCFCRSVFLLIRSNCWVIRSSVLPSHPFTYFSKEKVEAGGGGIFSPGGKKRGIGQFSSGLGKKDCDVLSISGLMLPFL